MPYIVRIAAVVVLTALGVATWLVALGVVAWYLAEL